MEDLKHIWKSTTNLDFFDEDYHRFLQLQRPENHQNSERYLNSVNGAVEQHSNPTIKRFRVCFVANPLFEADVFNWIQFAVNKKVEILELEFYTDYGYTGDPYPMYPFPKKLLSNQSCGYDSGFKFLKVLHLRRVDVTEEVLQYLLSNCAALERSTVNAARNLVYIRVVGPSISLKHLAVIDCSVDLKTIEVRDVKLVSFHVSGWEVRNMSLTNVPFLAEVSSMTSRSKSKESLITKLSSCISQLQILGLDITDDYRLNIVYPTLSNLRHLELKFHPDRKWDVVHFKCLIAASPYLHRLVLKLHKCTRPAGRKCRKMVRIDKFPRDYLKVVEIVGYHGTQCHDQLALYFAVEAAALEKLVIDPGRDWDNGFREWEEEGARDYAKGHLRTKVPSTVELVCL